jgi:ribonuclease HI
MTSKRSGADRIQEIVDEIAALPRGEKQRLVRLLIEAGHLPAGDAPLPSQLSLDTPPRPGSPDYVLTFDGGSKGNPGWGYGSYAITRVQDGAQRLERLNLGEPYTNNEAEYDTLIAALRDLLQRIEEVGRRPGEFSLEVRGDSALVLNQVKGRWKAKDPRMRQRRNRCVALLQRFDSVRFKNLPREDIVRVLGH